MSLHAQISPEAQAALVAQKRNSLISSVIIALLMLVLLGVILGVIALASAFKNNKEVIAYADSSSPTDEPIEPKIPNEIESKPSAPSANIAKVIATKTPSPAAVPVPDITVTDPSLNYGNDGDIGDGWGGDGNGNGPGGDAGIGIPAPMKKRCTKQDRLSRLLKEGGKKGYEDKVVASLRYLKKTQRPNGSWNAGGKPVAMTGLALLAYLGHCETPLSAEFGETVEKAILFLVNNGMKQGGKLATTTTDNHWCYEHAIATYALAEAYTLCKEFKVPIPNLKIVVKKAGVFIAANQHPSGGWDYAYDTSGNRGGDSSIVCWHLQAIHALEYTKLDINGLDKSGRNGIKYLGKCENGKGTIGYHYESNIGNGPTMTPGAALCLQQFGKGRRSFTRNAVKWSAKHSQFDYKKEANIYMHYYIAQCLMNAGGKYWQDYNAKVMTQLAAAQNKDGSWSVPGGPQHKMNQHYATCLATLMMEVYYRFLPSS